MRQKLAMIIIKSEILVIKLFKLLLLLNGSGSQWSQLLDLMALMISQFIHLFRHSRSCCERTSLN